MSNKSAVRTKKSALIMMPLVFDGTSSSANNTEILDAVYQQQAISNAIRQKLNKLGYSVQTEYSLIYESPGSAHMPIRDSQIWNKIRQYTDAGAYSKTKRTQYTLNPEQQKISNPDNYELLIAPQVYSDVSIPNNAANNIQGVAVGSAIATALVRSPTVFFASGGNIDYKLCIFDMKTGDLLWYREGFESGQDANSQGMFYRLFDSVLYDFPKSDVGGTVSKFKVKRSQLNGGNI